MPSAILKAMLITKPITKPITSPTIMSTAMLINMPRLSSAVLTKKLTAMPTAMCLA
ncbi:hypothetical protein GCM10011607_05770 [Shewanella inventionis]|uniref:Uncharacterized protein n=1 Tax=Shewanella inventionis TaxID=1738770 RepID=A0ABQ1ISJ2_9GAMM|nr:hypothetical protein GCM10011607_05770 [Shewanella inventionis]